MKFILIVLFSLADRFAGGGAPNIDARLPGRALFWGTLVCALAGLLIVGWPAMVLALIWGAHRSLAPDMWGGSADAKTNREVIGVALRFSLLIPAVVVLAHFASLDLPRAALCVAAFVIVATGLAVWYGYEVSKAVIAGEPIGSQNVVVELARGAAYGLMCVGVLS